MTTTTNGPSLSPSDFRGIYDVQEVAQYLRAGAHRLQAYSISPQKVTRWIRQGIASPELASVPGRLLLPEFADLISLRIIAALRASGVTLREIRTTQEWLREQTGAAHPFATEAFWTGQGDLFVEWAEHLVSGSRRGQFALDLIQGYLLPVPGLQFREDTHMASSWEPYEGILLNPLIQFGASCIKGTRIPTRSIAGMIEAGDSPEWLANSYQIPLSEVQTAYDWERLLHAN